MKNEFTHVWAITAHGELPYLEECICFIKAQTVYSDDIICTATDNEMIQALAQKYKIPVYIKTGKDDVRENWNFANNKDVGAWVTLAHQDGIYEKNYVEVLKKCAWNINDASISFSDYRPVDGNGKGAERNHDIQSIIKLPLKSKWLDKNIYQMQDSCCRQFNLLPHSIFS